MKLKLITLLLGITTITLCISTCFYYFEANIRTKVIADRELTITNYQKVIRAIGRSGGISINKLKTELKAEFDIDENMGFNDYNKEYYFVLNPKTYTINQKEILQFMGLELILNEYKNFKTISMYKP